MTRLVSFVASVLVVLAGCTTEAKGIETCQKIEEARCLRATTCGVTLATPLLAGDDPTEACVRFYKDACQHGLVLGADVPAAQRDACIAAINADCSAVVKPETHPDCAFLLIGSDASVDASVDAIPDTTVDTSVDAPADAGTDTAMSSDANDAAVIVDASVDGG